MNGLWCFEEKTISQIGAVLVLIAVLLPFWGSLGWFKYIMYQTNSNGMQLRYASNREKSYENQKSRGFETPKYHILGKCSSCSGQRFLQRSFGVPFDFSWLVQLVNSFFTFQTPLQKWISKQLLLCGLPNYKCLFGC